jgi:hypothetical protein
MYELVVYLYDTTRMCFVAECLKHESEPSPPSESSARSLPSSLAPHRESIFEYHKLEDDDLERPMILQTDPTALLQHGGTRRQPP